MDIQALHEKVLYPIVRVRGDKAGGSGVLVASLPDSKRSGGFINLVLTCEHVVDGLISLKEEWDTVLKKSVKMDILEEASVEVFDYDQSKVLSANATQASIVAYDKRHDLAVLRLHNFRQMPHVSTLLPRLAIPDLRLFENVWVSGCSLLHDPFASAGSLTYLREIIEQKTYLMYNAPSIFGNSGGALFRDDGTLLGLTSRITSLQLGFGVDIITWMGFASHPERLYEFADHQELQCIYDPAQNYYEGEVRRAAKRKQAMRELLLGPDDKKAPVGGYGASAE